MHTLNFFTVILAGGKSSRMGEDKRFLTLNGESLLDRCLNLARVVCEGDESRVLISGKVSGYNCIQDRMIDRGPLGGLWSVAQYLGETLSPAPFCLLVMPVDMPLIGQESLQWLKDQAVPILSECEHRVVTLADYELPFVMFVDEKSVEAIEACMVSELARDRSIRALQALLGKKELPFVGNTKFNMANVNTPQDWQFIQRNYSELKT